MGDQHTLVVQAVRQYMAWSKAWSLKVAGGMYQRKGIPDILACWPPYGRMVACEVKTGTARLTSEQEEELEKLALAGAVCVVAHEVEDLEEVLIKLEVIKEPLLVSRAQAAQWLREAGTDWQVQSRLRQLGTVPVE